VGPHAASCSALAHTSHTSIKFICLLHIKFDLDHPLCSPYSRPRQHSNAGSGGCGHAAHDSTRPSDAMRVGGAGGSAMVMAMTQRLWRRQPRSLWGGGPGGGKDEVARAATKRLGKATSQCPLSTFLFLFYDAKVL
jgi:hypothetical protein